MAEATALERRDPEENRGAVGARGSGQPAVPARGSEQRSVAGLALLALGVVYGDIGTSPIYAFKACFSPEYGVAPRAANVYGVVSLIVWALTLTVSIKYVALIMRADNHGEGGIFALLAIIRGRRAPAARSQRLALLISVGLFGAALLYGDGVITPAISVLSAVEGLGVASTRLASWAVPVSVAILFALFAAQRFGVTRVGGVFGPIMLVWFLTIATTGVMEIAHEPSILLAVNPWYGIRFFGAHGIHGFVILGAVVLAVTGAEALYADMGYFGRTSIRWSWYGLVFPALVLNYAGQGALVLRDAQAVSNPFFLLAPTGLVYPYVALATVATIIASQALISGAFALTNQAIQLGYAPRLEIRYTAPTSEQVFIPAINRSLMVGCLLLVVTFQSSGALGAAYGIAVTGTMAITTLLFFTIARNQWGWSLARALMVCGVFLVIDGSFLASNSLKIAHDGWVPLAIAVSVWAVMTTWAWGRECLLELRRRDTLPLVEFFGRLEREATPRVPGTAVFLTSHPAGAPRVLVRQLDYTHVLARQVVLLHLEFGEQPTVEHGERLSMTPLPLGFWRVVARFGFVEHPDLSSVLTQCRMGGLPLDFADLVFYLSSERLVLTPTRNVLSRWRKRLFKLMLRNSRSAPEFFGLPGDRVVELGASVTF